MTENEAIKELEKFQLQIEHSIAEEDCCEYGNSGKTLQEDKEFLDAFDVAITALKEIQQYRAMNRKLRKCFGDCDGLLKAVVDEICYRISVKEPTKLRLLANEDADMWDAYRAIGTVEELTDLMVVISEDSDKCGEDGIDLEFIKNLIELKHYRDIGTLEECREAMEKQKPKKPNRSGMDEQDYYVCPNCGADIGSIDDYFPRDRYCHECGQAIQWGENLEGMKDVTSEM